MYFLAFHISNIIYCITQNQTAQPTGWAAYMKQTTVEKWSVLRTSPDGTRNGKTNQHISKSSFRWCYVLGPLTKSPREPSRPLTIRFKRLYEKLCHGRFMINETRQSSWRWLPWQDPKNWTKKTWAAESKRSLSLPHDCLGNCNPGQQYAWVFLNTKSYGVFFFSLPRGTAMHYSLIS